MGSSWAFFEKEETEDQFLPFGNDEYTEVRPQSFGLPRQHLNHCNTNNESINPGKYAMGGWNGVAIKNSESGSFPQKINTLASNPIAFGPLTMMNYMTALVLDNITTKTHTLAKVVLWKCSWTSIT